MARPLGPALLLRDCEIPGRGACDVLIRDGLIEEVGPRLRAGGIARELDLGGGCVLPGLRDHHVHLLASAARRSRVSCRSGGPVNREWLVHRLRAGEAGLGPREWIHGVDLDARLRDAVDREWLDATFAERAVRIDDSSGHAAVMNTAALDRVAELNAAAAVGAREALTRAYQDGWLYNGHRRLRLPPARSQPPDLAPLGEELARAGVTGVCDATPGLSAAAGRALGDAVLSGRLPQRLQVLGDRVVAGAAPGPEKLVLADYDLPPYIELRALLATLRTRRRPVAVHSVTTATLYMLLSALEEVGTVPGDRIEHASVTPVDALPRIARLGLTVVTQPHFIFERGDRYLAEVDPAELPSLYRLRSFATHGIPLAAGSDGPVGSLDPWTAMRAAVSRQTRAGASIGPSERLTPAQAISLYLGDLGQPGAPLRIRPGMKADLCLLHVPWSETRQALDRSMVKATIVRGKFIYEAS